MNWIQWTVLYALVGMILGEFYRAGAKKDGLAFYGGAYFLGVTFWPLVLLVVVLLALGVRFPGSK